MRQREREVVTFEKELCVGGLSLAIKALFGYALNLSDTVLGVVYCVAFTNVNGILLIRSDHECPGGRNAEAKQVGVGKNCAENYLRKNNILPDFWLFSNMDQGLQGLSMVKIRCLVFLVLGK